MVSKSLQGATRAVDSASVWKRMAMFINHLFSTEKVWHHLRLSDVIHYLRTSSSWRICSSKCLNWSTITLPCSKIVRINHNLRLRIGSDESKNLGQLFREVARMTSCVMQIIVRVFHQMKKESREEEKTSKRQQYSITKCSLLLIDIHRSDSKQKSS